MDLHHTVVHGKHRRQPARPRGAVVGLALGLLAGAVVGAWPQDVTYAPDGRHVYTANVDDGTVAVVDVHAGVVTARIPTGADPTSVSVSPDGRRLFVTDFGDGTVRLLDAAGEQAR